LNEIPEARIDFWEPYFMQADEIIQVKMLYLAATDLVDKYDRVNFFDLKIEKMFSDEAPQAFCREYNLKLKRPALIIFNEIGFLVNFNISPLPADLYILDELAVATSELNSEVPKWVLMPDYRRLIMGSYYFRVVWPDFTEKSDRILIEFPDQNYLILK